MLEYGWLTAILMLSAVLGLLFGIKKGSVRGLTASLVTSFFLATSWATTESLKLGQISTAFFYLTGLAFFFTIGYGLGYLAKVDMQIQALRK